MKSTLYKFAFFLSLLTILSFSSVAHAGFGVSPGVINEDKLVAGTKLNRVIYLVQGNQTEDMKVKVSIESKDMADWITFKNGNEFTIPAGQQQYPLNVQINVPKGAKLGIYNAFIRVSTFPTKVDGSQITVALGGKVTVSLTVGNDVISSFNVKSINVLDVSEGDLPKAEVVVVNTGNVPVAPENSSFELFNKYGEIRLAYGENDLFSKTDPFSEGKTTLTYPLDVRLSVGEYWGHVKIYHDGKVIKELRTVFNVLPKTFIEKNIYAILAIIVILLFVFILWKKKRN